MKDASLYQQTRSHLAYLRLTAAAEALPELLTTSALLRAIDRASVHDDSRKSENSAPDHRQRIN